MSSKSTGKFTTNFYVIVEVLGPFWVFFWVVFEVLACFLGFENIVGGAHSVVNGVFFTIFTKRLGLSPFDLRISMNIAFFTPGLV